MCVGEPSVILVTPQLKKNHTPPTPAAPKTRQIDFPNVFILEYLDGLGCKNREITAPQGAVCAAPRAGVGHAGAGALCSPVLSEVPLAEFSEPRRAQPVPLLQAS